MMRIENNLRYSHCCLCGADNIHKVGDINYFSPVCYSTEPVLMLHPPELWVCAVCNSGFVQNAIPEEKSILLYKQGDSAKKYASEYTEEPKTKVVTEVLKKLLKKNMRLLDVGCNTGEFLDFARKRGCKTFGLEYSLSSLSILKQKGHTTYSSTKDVDGFFDIITAFDLVEHLYNLPNFLDTCLNLLSAEGHLIFLTGNRCCFWARLARANWWYVRYPEHIAFPSRKYFEQHPKLRLIDWIPTYADRCYDRPKFQVVMSIAKQVLTGVYSGLPSLGPDHVLIVIKRSRFP